MAPSTASAYDVRVWGHGYALEYFCHLRARKATGEHAKEIDDWIKKLVDTLVTEEIPGGGWNYANRRQQASFTTAPIVQSLLLAHSQGEKVPPEVFQRARKALEIGRYETGSFAYSGPAKNTAGAIDKLPGSSARSAACETTLMLLGGGKLEEVIKSIDAFFMNWVELEKRRQMPKTHEGEYKIAPYFFYYGHRYCTSDPDAAGKVPSRRTPEADESCDDGARQGWVCRNDRVFECSRNYGTAMVTLILLNDKAPLPPALTAKTPAAKSN